jgi:hypothetical protein
MLTRKMDYAALATAGGALGAISFGMSLYFMPRSDLELKDYAIPLSITAYIYIRNAHRFTLDKDPPPSGDPLPASSSPPESLSALRRTCLSVLWRRGSGNSSSSSSFCLLTLSDCAQWSGSHRASIM